VLWEALLWTWLEEALEAEIDQRILICCVEVNSKHIHRNAKSVGVRITTRPGRRSDAVLYVAGGKAIHNLVIQTTTSFEMIITRRFAMGISLHKTVRAILSNVSFQTPMRLPQL
jgi:hypothetical protein